MSVVHHSRLETEKQPSLFDDETTQEALDVEMTAKIKEIKELLLKATDAFDDVNKPRIHQQTRDGYRAQAEATRNHADVLIARLFGLNPESSEGSVAMVSIRASLRNEAIKERRAENAVTAKGAALGSVAYRDVNQGDGDGLSLDWQQLAAGDGVRRLDEK